MTTPAQMLDAAEQEFRHHRFTAGANLVWDAAYQSVTAAAHCVNLPCCNEQEAYDIAEMLDRKHFGEPVHHWLRIRAADVFRTQAAHHGEDGDWQWDQDEYIESLADIRAMIAWLPQSDTPANVESQP